MSTNAPFGDQTELTARVVADRMAVDSVDVSMTHNWTNPDTQYGTKAGWKFSYSIPSKGNGYKKTFIQVSDQGNHRPKLEFHHSAQYLPFEDIVAYRKRRIKDRFPPTKMVEYCRAVGIEIFDEAFYSGSSFVVKCTVLNPSPGARRVATPTYAEAQERV